MSDDENGGRPMGETQADRIRATAKSLPDLSNYALARHMGVNELAVLSALTKKSRTAINLVGQKFGMLTVVRRNGRIGRNTAWLCRCDCGNETAASTHHLRTGAKVSCGCRRLKHGHGGRGERRSSEYCCWFSMIARCANPARAHYGGRGIRVCDRWSSFESFLADMGPKPSPKHSLDRIDVNGNYEPGNCRWATKKEQARNTRANHRLSAFGKTGTLADWSDWTGINPATISSRIHKGWSPERAVTVSQSVRGDLQRRDAPKGAEGNEDG